MERIVDDGIIGCVRLLHSAATDDGARNGEVDVATAYAEPLGRHTDRPWVMLCMVASIDGSTVVDGRSAAL